MPADLLNSVDLSGFSSDPSRADYANPAYFEQVPRWSLVADVRAGTETLRAKKEKYLPKFESETPVDWEARIAMTFADDHYSMTLAEHVGLVMSEPVKLGDDVPPALKELAEDIDGEGNHLDVFATTALDQAMHFGHVVLLTDYPTTDNVKTHADEIVSKARPYVVLFPAPDVLNWREVNIGGVKVIVYIKLRQHMTEPDGEFGVRECIYLKELMQAVTYDEVTGRATSLGAITWRLWREVKGSDSAGSTTFEPAGEGTIVGGPEHIPVRIIYGGEKIGTLHSKPHLHGMALATVEHTQVKSDYANVMHKCNVPTPIFVGRDTSGGVGTTVVMGQGIDIPASQGAGASMLEPSGAALNATRNRILDIETRMRRMGASTAQGETSRVMTATEAAQDAKARNAKITRAARSEQDGIEGVLSDMAAFSKIEQGGSVTVNQNFANTGIDPAYLSVLVNAYNSPEQALTLEELRFAIQTGQLPETFDANDVLNLVAAAAAKQAQAEADAKLKAEALAKQTLPSGQPPEQQLPAAA